LRREPELFICCSSHGEFRSTGLLWLVGRVLLLYVIVMKGNDVRLRVVFRCVMEAFRHLHRIIHSDETGSGFQDQCQGYYDTFVL
jgi:hypothetical protein